MTEIVRVKPASDGQSFALVRDGAVVGVVHASPDTAAVIAGRKDAVAIELAGAACERGWTFDGTSFAPSPEVVAERTLASVNAELDEAVRQKLLAERPDLRAKVEAARRALEVTESPAPGRILRGANG